MSRITLIRADCSALLIHMSETIVRQNAELHRLTRTSWNDGGLDRLPQCRWKTTSSNPMPRSALSFAFFASSLAKYFTALSVAERVPARHTFNRTVLARARVAANEPRDVQAEPLEAFLEP